TNEKDAHGNVQLSGTGALGDMLSEWVKSGTSIKRVRADTLGYIQRSFLGCVSETDQREAREVGEKAAQYAIGHGLSGSVSIVRVGNYRVEYKLSALKDVARESVHMPDKYINADANGVTPEFIEYVRPLVGPLPTHARFSAPKVQKVLNK
ncbi:MAG TPA: 6-phosphofructokinase, partial [Candidatus Hydrogenedentes bacterium]|nr:6-phosphofructokinase [Candidatus Hydrogenedentota bacterium]